MCRRVEGAAIFSLRRDSWKRALEWNCDDNFDSVGVGKVNSRKENRMSKEQSGLVGPRPKRRQSEIRPVTD